MSNWSLECRFAGLTFFPTLAENPSVSAQASLWSPRTAARSANISFLDDIGIAKLVAAGHWPQTGLAILRYNDVIIVEGGWSQIEFGPIGTPCRITIGESTQDDTATIPASGIFLRRLTEQEAAFGTDDKVMLLGRTPIDWPGYGPEAAQATLLVWGNISRVAEGRTYPFVIGAPGSATHPGSPALFVDTISTPKKWVIAGHMVNASTVTFGVLTSMAI